MATIDLLHRVPEAHRAPFERVVDEVVGVAELTSVEPVTGGASGALAFRVAGADRVALVRVETARDFFRDPRRVYPCMLAAAEAGVAPRVHVADVEHGIAAMDFIDSRPLDTYPGGVDGLVEGLGALIARLQATAPFATAMADFGALIARMLDVVETSGVFRASALSAHRELLEQIRAAYPFGASSLVSAHNDVNPFNVLYDGDRLWLVDWELAFGNDPFADIAIVANNYADTPPREDALLRAWLGRDPGADDRARLRVMRQLSRLFYGLLIASGFGGQRHDEGTDALTPEEFAAAFASGALRAGTPDTLFELGKTNLLVFAGDGRSPAFIDALAQCRGAG